MATGRLYKRGKYWYLDIYTGRVVDGVNERKRYRAKGELRKDAQDELDEVLYKLRRADKGEYALDDEYPLSQLYIDWCAYLKISLNNERTRYHYAARAQRLIEGVEKIGEHRVSSLAPQNIDRVIENLTVRYSNRSINDSITALKMMLEYGVSRKYIRSNPLAAIKQLPKKTVLRRRALTVEEGRALLLVASPSFYIVWLFVLSTGVRKGELLELTWDRVDLEKAVVYVHPSDEWKPKTETSVRVLPLSDKLVAELRTIQKPTGYVFSTRDGEKREHNLVRELRRHLRRALLKLNGLPLKPHYKAEELLRYGDQLKAIKDDVGRIDLHCLRYTFCTHLISNGVDIKTVQKLMGHSSPEVTLRIYAQYCHGNAEYAINSLPW